MNTSRKLEESRRESIILLKSKKFTDSDLLKTGNHLIFRKVTLLHLLAAWVVHDLNHVSQILRVIAKLYKIRLVNGQNTYQN